MYFLDCSMSGMKNLDSYLHYTIQLRLLSHVHMFALHTKRLPEEKGRCEEKVLDSLGIDKSISIRGSLITLGKMTLGHTIIAIVGLLFNTKDM